MTQKELTETLKDMYTKASDADEAFWMIVQGKSEPTGTDRVLMKFLNTNEIYYEVLTDDADAMAEGLYDNSQNTHTAKQLAKKVVNLLNSSPDDDETADVLALFASSDPDAEEDRWLNTIIAAVFDAGFKVYALNDGLLEVEPDAEPGEEEEEEVPPAKTPAKKAPAKKASAARPAPEPEPDEDEGVKSPPSYSRDELEEMDLKQLKEVAASLDIELPSRTRPKTYIDAILGEGKGAAPEAEVEATPTIINTTNTSGTTAGINISGVPMSVESVAETAANIVLRKLSEVFAQMAD